jgi:hypothetical protein
MDVFSERKITCPVCRKESTARFPNPKLYAAAKRESDQHVLAYTWGQGLHTPVLPHHYAVWQCPHCLYADFRDALENPRHGFTDKKVWLAYQEQAAALRPLLNRMRERVSEKEFDPLSAVALHLAAYRIARLGAGAEADPSKLGRLALRLAWLLRELGGETPQKTNPVSTAQHNLDRSVAELDSSLLAVHEALAGVRRHGIERSQELGLDPASGDNPYLTGTGALASKLEEAFGLLAILQRTLLLDREGRITSGGAVAVDAGLAEFLLSLLPLWPDLPRDEKSCLRQAVEWFDLSYRSESSDQSMEQGLNLITLNVDLLMRVGDLTKAFEYVAQILKNGTNTRWELQRRMNEGKKSGSVNGYDERAIQRKIATVGQLVEQGKLLRRRIAQLMLERKEAEIISIVKANEQRPLFEQEEALHQAGFNEEICAILKERGTLKEPPKKAGLFGRR